MRIDNSRFTAFWANPELYRLVYERNLSPKVTPFPLARGIHFHTLAEARNKNLSPDATKRLVIENKGITEKARLTGEAMFAAFKRKYDGDTRFKLAYDDGKPLAEIEFDIAIPGSPHFIVGKMDEIVEFEGDLWTGDFKTANAKASEAKKRIEFGFSSQPLFYINAARLMGYDVKGMLYRVTTEHTPPQHYIIKSKRTERQLSAGLINIHQTAETIEMMRRTFGPDKPWIHLHSSYPCNYSFNGKSACEYADICGKADYELTEEDLENFTNRVDHINLMRGREHANN